MLAVAFDLRLLRFPYFASPKLDGIRCLVLGGHEVTRAGKRVPNVVVREFFERNGDLHDGLDGELVVGDPTAPDCFSLTMRGIMSNDSRRPGFSLFEFDVVDCTGKRPFTDRWKEAQDRVKGWPPNVGLVLQEPVEDLQRLARFADVVVRQGYEGVILRRPNSQYKQGRATLAVNSLLKIALPRRRTATANRRKRHAG